MKGFVLLFYFQSLPLAPLDIHVIYDDNQMSTLEVADGDSHR